MDDKNKIALVVVSCIVILTIILVSMSFSGLDYDECGFKKQRSTGVVDTKIVDDFGLYLFGPDYEFKVFPTSAQNVNLRLNIFTKDKLEIEMEIYFQYFLRKEDLPLLHKFYDLYYDPTIRSSATAALKTEAPRYSTDEYIKERKKVESGLFQVLRERLGGECCAKDCSSWKYACPDGCTPVDNCDVERKKGLWVDVKYFQLGAIVVPDDLSERFLKSLTLQEDDAREKFKQEAAVVRKESLAASKDIKNQANEVLQEAEAESQLIHTVSLANYTATVEKARSQGLKQLYTKLGITNQDMKNSFDYLRTLRGLDNVHLTVDFQQRIAGNFK